MVRVGLRLTGAKCFAGIANIKLFSDMACREISNLAGTGAHQPGGGGVEMDEETFLVGFGRIWSDLVGFGWIWLDRG
jgi:hypothetical protein